eukprot:6691780-Pyramimonas_sp.AAC.1
MGTREGWKKICAQRAGGITTRSPRAAIRQFDALINNDMSNRVRYSSCRFSKLLPSHMATSFASALLGATRERGCGGRVGAGGWRCRR